MAEKAIMDSLDALSDGDLESSRRVVEADGEINAKRFEIEEKCIFVVAESTWCSSTAISRSDSSARVAALIL